MQLSARQRIWSDLRAFDEDQDGIEALQVVMIIAIAAVVLLLVTGTLFPQVKDWVTKQLGKLVKFK